jgi:hypothetical protein
MHIPRGYWHQATRADRDGGMSLHITFGFPKRTGVDWLAWLADQARGTEVFRHDLLRGTGDEPGRIAQERALADAAVELVRSSPPAAFLASREQEQPPRRHPPALPVGCRDEEPGSVVCITEFEPTCIADGDNVTVAGGGKRLTVRTKARPALDRLLSGVPVDVATLGAETGVDVRRLADLMIREGMCVGLTPELSSGYTDLIMATDC